MANKKLRIMRRPEVEQITGLGRAAIYDQVKKGKFPAPIKLSVRSVGWLQGDVQDWIAERVRVSQKEVIESGS